MRRLFSIRQVAVIVAVTLAVSVSATAFAFITTMRRRTGT